MFLLMIFFFFFFPVSTLVYLYKFASMQTYSFFTGQQAWTTLKFTIYGSFLCMLDTISFFSFSLLEPAMSRFIFLIYLFFFFTYC